MDGWLTSNGSVSVRHLSFPLEFTIESGERGAAAEQRGGKNYYITLVGAAVKLTATWVFSDKISYLSPLYHISPYYEPALSL